MTGCVESGLGTLQRDIEATIEQLGRAAEQLLRDLSPEAPATGEAEGGEWRCEVPVSFPDGVGTGRVVAELFRYHDSVRLDLRMDHNRRLATPAGGPSERRCFFNDFEASVRLAPGTSELPAEFRRKVVRGIDNAIHGVQRHNRQFAQPWHQVRVAAV
jgi:hypothetical protein